MNEAPAALQEAKGVLSAKINPVATAPHNI